MLCCFRITASKNKDFTVGTLVSGMFGWRTYTVVSEMSKLIPLPELGGLSPSLALGIMGMPG